MATSRPTAQLHEKSSCSDTPRRAQAAVPSSSESGTTSPQCKSPSLQHSVPSVSKSARSATRKPVEKPAPRSHLPQRTAAPASSVKERASKASSSVPRPASSSTKQATAIRKPVEKPVCSRSHPPQRTVEASTSSVKERALKNSPSAPRAATSSAKQATGTRSPIEKPSPHRPQPLQSSSSAGMSSAKERALKTSSPMPSQRPAAATCSAKDRALKTSSSVSRAATAAAKQASATTALKAGRTTMTTQPCSRTRKNPGSAVSKRKETPPVAAPSTAQKQAVVTAGENDEKEASVWVDKQELVSASYIVVRVHDVSEVNNDPVPEILEPSSPPVQASPRASNGDGDDHDQDDFDVSGDEQELVSPSSVEGCPHGEHEPSSPEQTSQLTSSVEGSDRDRDDIDVPEYEQEHVSTSSVEGHADDEPEANNVPVHEQQDEPSSPPRQASELTSNANNDEDDTDVPRDELLQLQASEDKPVAEISSKEQDQAEKEKADAEDNQKSPEMLGSPTGDLSLSTAWRTVQAKREAQIGNEMIEETRTKLVARQKSKVKALVGAFETVISLQDPDGQTDQSLGSKVSA